MPKVSDVMKVPFSGLAAAKGFATGNYGDAIANAGLAVGQFGYAFGKYYIPSDKWKKEFGKEVYLLEIGIQLVSALTLLHGSATDQGQYYEQGAAQFELAWENLKDAAVNSPSWSGDAAEAYNARNAQQLDWAATMADLDTKIAAILAREAGELKDAKLNLTYCRAAFTVAIPVAVALRAYNPAASWIFQLMTFTSVMTTAVIITDMMRMSAGDNALEVEAITQQYRAVADSAVVTGSEAAASAAAPASASTVGEFGDVSSVAPPVAPAPGMAVPAPVTGATGGLASPSANAAPSGDAETAGSSPGPSHREATQIGVAPSYTTPAASRASTGTPSRVAAGPGAPRHRASGNASTPAASVEEGFLPPGADGATAGGQDVERAPIDAVAGGAGQRGTERRGEDS